MCIDFWVKYLRVQVLGCIACVYLYFWEMNSSRVTVLFHFPVTSATVSIWYCNSCFLLLRLGVSFYCALNLICVVASDFGMCLFTICKSSLVKSVYLFSVSFITGFFSCIMLKNLLYYRYKTILGSTVFVLDNFGLQVFVPSV